MIERRKRATHLFGLERVETVERKGAYGMHTRERVIEMAVRLFKAYHARAVRVGTFF